MKFPAMPAAALVAQNGTSGSAVTSEPADRRDGRVPAAEAGRVRHYIAGLEQDFRLNRRQVVGQRL
jgi:hypothetical protein